MSLKRKLQDEPLDEKDAKRLAAVTGSIGPAKVGEGIGISQETLARALARMPIRGPTRSAIHLWLEGRNRYSGIG